MHAAELFGTFRRWSWLLAISAALVAGGFAFLLTRLVPPTYQATSTLLVTAGTSALGADLRDVETSEQLARAFRPLVTLRSVLEGAIDRANLAMTAGELESIVTVSNSMNLLEITVLAGSAPLASGIANAMADAFIDPGAGTTDLRDVVTVVEPAEVPGAPIAPNPAMNALIAGLLALLAVIGAGFLANHLDDTIRSPQDILALTSLPTIAQVSQFRGLRSPAARFRPVDPESEASEAYRAVRTYLTRSDRRGGGGSILITGPGTGEGRSTTTANLAVAFGLSGSNVVVVDADLRRPSQHILLRVAATPGVIDVLTRRVPVESALQATSYSHVSILPSGGVPSNPAEILARPGLTEMLAALQQRFDVILIDSPPALPYTDAALLAGAASLAVLVIRQRVTRSGELQAAIEVLAPYDAVVTGVVLNGVDASSRYSKGDDTIEPGRVSRMLDETQAGP